MPAGEFEIISPLPVSGISIAVAEAGIKSACRRDLTCLYWSEASTVAATFTQNRFCAAPVMLAKKHLLEGPRIAIINTGYANAGTGHQGISDASVICESVAAFLGLNSEQVLPFSTGVIGEALPVETINKAIPQLISSLNDHNWLDAAEAIMTTDTKPKAGTVQFEYEGQTYTITGIAKGAGMIKPNMATMLSFIATDMAIEGAVLQSMLGRVVERSFNCITVDGDTSTNDACLLIATGAAQNSSVQCDKEPLASLFYKALKLLSTYLAQQIVRDGEGASKFIAIKVGQANSYSEAKALAYDIAHSPLVKTALFASDPNWGRILAVVGRSDIRGLDIHQVDIWLGSVCVVQGGELAACYSEQQGARQLQGRDIEIRVNLSRGDAHATVWTTDLSHEYIRINAEYRT